MAVAPKDELNTVGGDDAKEDVWFQVKKKKLSDLADGATYALTVENEERHIFIGYRITEGYTHMGLMWKKDTHAELLPAIDVNDTEALAFDHAYILNTALDRLEEMPKEYREQLE